MFSRHKIFIFLTIFACAGNFGSEVFSQALTSEQEQRAVQQNIQNEQRMERERMDIIRQREIKEIRTIKKFDKGEKIDEQADVDKGGCLVPKSIEFKGNSLFSKKYLRKKFLKSFEEKCFSKLDIVKIQKDLTNFYIDKGYSNARVYFDKNKLLKERILIFFIAEGFVENITLDEGESDNHNKYLDTFLSARNSTKKFTTFPLLKNKPFNLRDFEQGLDQMNRLQSNNATLDSAASKLDGFSDIVIRNQITNPTNLTFGYDNLGQESTGKYRRKLSLSQDNLLAFNDNIYLNYVKDDVPHDLGKMSQSLYSAITIPLGYYTFSASYSQSKYLTTIVDNAVSFTSSGQTTQVDYAIERMLFRGKRSKLSFKTDLALKDTQSFIRDVKIPAGSRKLTLLGNSINYKLNHDSKNPGEVRFTYVNLSYIKGVNWFDAKHDSFDINKTSPHAQFDKLYLTLTHSVPFAKRFIYKASLDVQHSFDTLFGSERFSLGGPYSVRGFDENNLSTDNGYFIKNDIEMRLPGNNSYTNKTLVSVFYDYGYGRSKYLINQTDEGYMSGTGIRMRYPDGKYFDWDLTYSRGLHVPKAVLATSNQTADKETIYFNINLKFGI